VNLIDRLKLLFVRDKRFAKELCAVIGFIPVDSEFYKIPFIHRSSSILYKGSLINYERLEYLGDAVLDVIVADFLFTHYQQRDEGFLSQMRSKIVKRQNLNQLGVELGLHQVMLNQNNNQLGKNYFGDVLEALIGALYLKRGYRYTKRFVLNKIIRDRINLTVLENTETDFKSRLIEWAQKNKYEIKFESKEEYPEGEKVPHFVCQVFKETSLLAQGTGSAKKEAEQNAAEQAIKYLGIIDYSNI
jgi:ribonuclease III